MPWGIMIYIFSADNLRNIRVKIRQRYVKVAGNRLDHDLPATFLFYGRGFLNNRILPLKSSEIRTISVLIITMFLFTIIKKVQILGE